MNRRQFLFAVGDFALFAALPGALRAEAAAPIAAGAAGRFLDARQLAALRALCAQLVPGPPEDPDPGAVEAGVPESIDLLLGAFAESPPRVFAGGPFSLRHGGGENAFAKFLALDAIEERVWRTRIEGSQGRPEREWNGPVVGLQQIYRDGLAALDAAATRWFDADFAALRPWQAKALLLLGGGELRRFADVVFGHALEGMYGAPEYGGNRGEVGWRFTRWPGDHQPHSYAPAEISEPDADQTEAAARARRNAERWLASRAGAQDQSPASLAEGGRRLERDARRELLRLAGALEARRRG
jgi:hypothetical protein